MSKRLETLSCGMVLWSAGFARNPLLDRLQPALDPTGRLRTNNQLQLVDRPDVYAFGDCACVEDQVLPQLAQVAEQQGRFLARHLNAQGHGQSVPPFRWKRWGVSSFLGGGAAVAESGSRKVRLSGQLAYQQWRAAIWTQLVSVRGKILVPLDRLRAFLFGRDISKL